MERPIFCFTNEPISDELFEILQKLEKKEEVTLEEINSTPEFVMGQQMCSTEKNTIDMKGRGELRKDIVEKLSSRGSASTTAGKTTFNGPVKNEKKLDIVIGFSASGKSSAVAEKISASNSAVIIDNDEVKKEIPEFDRGWGANRVHEESKKINKQIFAKALEEGKNIVLPKVGGDVDGIEFLINMAKKKGYTVNLHYVEVDKHAALERLLMRFITQGRFLPPQLIFQEVNENDKNNIEKTYDELKEKGIIDGYAHWDNNVPKSCPPNLVEQKNIDKAIIYGITTEMQKFYSDHIIPHRHTRNEMMYNIVAGHKTMITKILNTAKEENRPIDRDELIAGDTSKLSALLTAAQLGYLRKGLEYYDADNIKTFIRDAKAAELLYNQRLKDPIFSTGNLNTPPSNSEDEPGDR